MSVQFGEVPPAKLRPLLGVVAKPTAQWRAGRNILEPGVHTQIALLDPAQPQPLHQEPCPVFRAGFLIGSFQGERRHWDRSCKPLSLARDGTKGMPAAFRPAQFVM